MVNTDNDPQDDGQVDPRDIARWEDDGGAIYPPVVPVLSTNTDTESAA